MDLVSSAKRCLFHLSLVVRRQYHSVSGLIASRHKDFYHHISESSASSVRDSINLYISYDV